jgi:hypothetical protein
MMYDKSRKCWIVELSDKHYDLHCGESFELIIGSYCIPCRLELGTSCWYIILENVVLNLRTRETYIVNV